MLRTFPEGMPLYHHTRLASLDRIAASTGADELTTELETLDRCYHDTTGTVEGDGCALLRVMAAYVAEHPDHFFTGGPGLPAR